MGKYFFLTFCCALAECQNCGFRNCEIWIGKTDFSRKTWTNFIIKSNFDDFHFLTFWDPLVTSSGVRSLATNFLKKGKLPSLLMLMKFTSKGEIRNSLQLNSLMFFSRSFFSTRMYGCSNCLEPFGALRISIYSAL